jgi:hypothetical protein
LLISEGQELFLNSRSVFGILQPALAATGPQAMAIQGKLLRCEIDCCRILQQVYTPVFGGHALPQTLCSGKSSSQAARLGFNEPALSELFFFSVSNIHSFASCAAHIPVKGIFTSEEAMGDSLLPVEK